MLVGIYQSIVIFIVILAIYVVDFTFIRRYDKQRRASGSGFSWDFAILMFVAGMLIVLQPIFLPWLGWSTPQLWGLVVQILGITAVVCAFALHIWARLHLRHFYAERVEVQPDHRVVDTGPYALMRHPVIASIFGWTTGLFMFNPAITTLLMMVYTFWNFSNSARQEEKLLSNTLPDYAAYMKCTPRFIPRPRRIK